METKTKLEKVLDDVDGSVLLEFEGPGMHELSVSFDAVYAFVAADAHSVPGGLPPTGVRSAASTIDTSQAIRQLPRFDPADLPDIEGTMRDIGPGAGRELIRRMESGDSLTLRRSERLLRRLPVAYQRRFSEPSAAVRSHLLSDRIFTIMQVSETPDAAGAQLLRGTFSHTSEAIRYMAARSRGIIRLPTSCSPSPIR